MKIPRFPQHQAGVALVLSLLLLLVLTIIGVAAMNSTVMQERMAGNLRMQTQVFEVASEGVSRSIDFYYDNLDDINEIVGHQDGLMCGFVHGAANETSVVTEQLAWRYPADEGEFITIFDEDGFLLEQQMYCCRSWAPAPELDPPWMENPSKLFVLSRGTFVTGDENDPDRASLARREVEVRLDEADPGLPTCALCIPGGVGDFEGGQSNMQMHGSCGPAITTHGNDSAGNIIGGIADKNIGNYDGGIVGTDDPTQGMGRPWDDANELAEMIWWMKLGVELAHVDGGGNAGYWDFDLVRDETSNLTRVNPQRYRFTGNPEFGVQSDIPNGDYGTPVINYFDRGVEMGGNVTGHGIMVVNGHVDWAGVPDYEGLLISIGGGFDVSGGGGGGGRGSLVMTNIVINNDDLESHVQAVTNRPEQEVPEAFGSKEILRYPVAVDGDGYVLMYDPDDTLTNLSGEVVEDVPSRPALYAQDPVGTMLSIDVVYYYDPDDDAHRFFRHDTGEELMARMVGNSFELCDPDLDSLCNPGEPIGIVHWAIPFLPYDPSTGNVGQVPRDKFGRLIPNFVPIPDSVDPVWADNWPHPAIEYHPNRWGWGLCGDDDEPEFCGDPPFAYDNSDFYWSGGGGQNFTYDCRRLQRIRQRLLCQDQAKIVEGTSDFDPPNDLPPGYEYDDPDYSLICEHHEWAHEYNDDVLDLGGSLHNHFAWHLWDPSCECLGLTADSDIILSGWRENLGWRDDDFAVCAGLPGPGD